MPTPYILNPIKPFKIDSSKPIEPQIEMHIRGRADYMPQSQCHKIKVLFCGCSTDTSLIWKNNQGHFVKPLSEDAVIVICRYCKCSIKLDNNKQHNILNQIIGNT